VVLKTALPGACIAGLTMFEIAARIKVLPFQLHKHEPKSRVSTVEILQRRSLRMRLAVNGAGQLSSPHDQAAFFVLDLHTRAMATETLVASKSDLFSRITSYYFHHPFHRPPAATSLLSPCPPIPSNIGCRCIQLFDLSRTRNTFFGLIHPSNPTN